MDKFPEPKQFPPEGQFADKDDSNGWDVARDGHMADFATEDGVVETEDYDPTTDPEAADVLGVEDSDALSD